VELGCVLLDETNLGWMAKSKVVLDYKLKHFFKTCIARFSLRGGEQSRNKANNRGKNKAQAHEQGTG
jgi:hypothetical protein